MYRKGKALRKLPDLTLEAGDKITVKHEPDAKILMWSKNGEELKKLACRKVDGLVTPAAFLLQGSVVKVTYLKPPPKPVLEGVAAAADALKAEATDELNRREAAPVAAVVAEVGEAEAKGEAEAEAKGEAEAEAAPPRDAAAEASLRNVLHALGKGDGRAAVRCAGPLSLKSTAALEDALDF